MTRCGFVTPVRGAAQQAALVAKDLSEAKLRQFGADVLTASVTRADRQQLLRLSPGRHAYWTVGRKVTSGIRPG